MSYVTPYWAAFLLSMLGFMIYSVSNVGFVQLVGYIVDSLGGNDALANTSIAPVLNDILGEPESLNRLFIPAMIVLIVFARGIGTFIGNYFLSVIGTNLVHTLRVELF
ncbi:MAG: lipid ABC transporter permease/ATP-binding protein, partial [Pseudomonadales bacterium]